MFLTFLFRSAPEEGLYCKPRYRAKIGFFKKQIYFSYSSFCCLFYQARHLRRWDQFAVNILYLVNFHFENGIGESKTCKQYGRHNSDKNIPSREEQNLIQV